ncbi:Cysteinyl-tRNA synthetase [Patulibacter medicamentivorans]|uniref:Cysteine--tRNA ligase n=1 Tax=Patulibacter medicamentivorans TaxID=1097667 RepID=H0E1D3_9ACTN|nr:cysteine--tRNA ligase [Patulibacter medicamentivorans]EHN12487.1 Cysteinyl-tRNA synthetase [Patulibacter medicamentivorans]
MRTIHLHDTASGALTELRPREPGKVGIYACGPTVYNRIHVGNARPFVVYALLKRFLQQEGYDVTLVANLTDVNDKIYAAAVREGVSSSDLARQMGDLYRADTDLLELGRPDHEPLVTTSMDAIIALIAELLRRDAAYAAEGDVYFRVRRDARYGSLSHRDVDQMDQGEGDDRSSLKQDPLDFALWKATKPGEDTAWDTPWGRGRPGWHIECSAMAEELLGVGFEIHGGGSDLVFPHHENEAAQTRCARDRELAQIWMHNGMLQLRGEKMAKSVGNVTPLHEAVAEVGRDGLLLLFCGAHYRQPVQYSEETIEQARAGVRRIRETGRLLHAGPSPDDLATHRDAFLDALADDFNTAAALAHLWSWVREANRRGGVGDEHLRQMLAVLGLENLLDAAGGDGPDAAALALLEERQRAREARDWARADEIRDALAAAGWTVRDGADGAELIRVEA